VLDLKIGDKVRLRGKIAAARRVQTDYVGLVISDFTISAVEAKKTEK
jgi:hypothetical protein